MKNICEWKAIWSEKSTKSEDEKRSIGSIRDGRRSGFHVPFDKCSDLQDKGGPMVFDGEDFSSFSSILVSARISHHGGGSCSRRPQTSDFIPPCCGPRSVFRHTLLLVLYPGLAHRYTVTRSQGYPENMVLYFGRSTC
jgi:hypothetical protein